MGVRGRRWLDLSVVAFAAAALLALFGDTAADPDLWGHVRFGQLMRRLGFIPRHDPYAYTEAGRVWINHEWLAEWLFGWAWDAAGAWGLVLVRLLFVGTTLGLAADHLRRRGVGPLLSAIMLILAALPMQTGFGNVRPQLFTFLCLAIVLIVLGASRHRPGRLWILPPVFAVWINAHGGVLAGLGLVGIWFVAERLEAWTARGSRGMGKPGPTFVLWAGVGAASAAALLLNPYGLELPRFLLETATVPRPLISEWIPLGLSSAYGAVYLLLLAVGAALLVASRRVPRIPELALLVVSALLPFLAIRHLALFGIVWIVTLADPAAEVWERVREGRSSGDGIPDRGSLLRSAAVLALLVGAAGLTVYGTRNLGCVNSSSPETMDFPRETVRYLARVEGPRRLVVHFSWGEYAIWHLGPRIQVSMDGRRETVYPDSVYNQHMAFLFGRGDWRRHLETPSADLALVERDGPAANLLELASDWTLWVEGSAGVLYARDRVTTSLPPGGASALAAGEESGRTDEPWCFPE